MKIQNPIKSLRQVFLFILLNKLHQSASEIRPHKAVDDEVDGRIEHDHVPDDAVQQPPLGGDVVPTLSLIALENVGDGEDFIERKEHSGNV